MSGGTEQTPADSAQTPTPAVGWEGWDPRGWRSPIYVATVDIAEPIADLKCLRSVEPPYTAAWILVLDSGYPMGCVEVPVDGDVVSAEKIQQEIRRQIGSRTAAARPAPTAALPRISVVIPTNLARPDQMQRCAARLAELDYPDYEVIIVDNRQGGGPPAEFPGARVVREPVRGISAARNRGIDVATGEIIAFTDDDVLVDRRWLRAIGERFASEPDLAALSGIVIPLELETPAQVMYEQFGNCLERGLAPLTFERSGRFHVLRRVPGTGAERVGSLYKMGEFGQGANMAFRADALRARGGFDEALGTGTPTHGGEDLTMLVELLATGHRLAYEPGAIIHHSHRATMEELERQLHGYGIGFTAMLLGLAIRNPWHFVGLASVIPAYLRTQRDPSEGKQSHRPDDYPQSLARAELRGMLGGPAAYLRSCWIHRRRLRWSW
jgi:cellulose synthase/poly-beta-1,6-N-acetylglucosamine synthase-like glycosyltransferase